MSTCISAFFKDASEDEKLVDLDWLDVDTDSYVNAPFGEHPPWDKKDELAELWAPDPLQYLDFSDKEKYLKKILKNPLKDNAKDVVKFAKVRMLMGKTEENVAEDIKANFSAATIKEAKNDLNLLFKEELGLMGNVYIDPSAFKNCKQGALFLKKNQAKLAKYALKMDKCAGCSYNSSNSCSLFGKKLTSSVNYSDDQLHQHYYDHLRLSKKIEKWEPSKENLRKAFLIEEEQQVKQAETFLKDEKPELKLHQISTVQQLDTERVSIQNRLSKMIMKGAYGDDLKNKIKHSFNSDLISKYNNLIKAYIDKQGALGHIFIETKPFSDAHELKAFLKEIPNSSPYILNNNSNINDFDCKSLYNAEDGQRERTVIYSLNSIPKAAFEQQLKKLDKKATLSEDYFTSIKTACLTKKKTTKEGASAPEVFTESFFADKTAYADDTIDKFSTGATTYTSEGIRKAPSFKNLTASIKDAIVGGYDQDTIEQYLISKNIPSYQAKELIKEAACFSKAAKTDLSKTENYFQITKEANEYVDEFDLQPNSLDEDIDILKL